VASASAWLLLALSFLAGPVRAAEDAAREAEPTRVPAGVLRYAPSVFPDRIVVSPAQDAARGFAVAWGGLAHGRIRAGAVAGDRGRR